VVIARDRTVSRAELESFLLQPWAAFRKPEVARKNAQVAANVRLEEKPHVAHESAFGETLRATGSFAQGNPFRFSSKYTDDESGLLYYGRRYYSPSQGRWLGRDPVEEKGGLHLYGFVGNNPINHYDVLGMIFNAYYSAPGVGWRTYLGDSSNLDIEYGDFTAMYDMLSNLRSFGGPAEKTYKVTYSDGTTATVQAGSSAAAVAAANQATNSFQAPSRGASTGWGTIMIQDAHGNMVPLGSAAANNFADTTTGSGPNSGGSTFGQLPSQVIPGGTGTSGGVTSMTPFKVNENTRSSGSVNSDFAAVVNGFSQYSGALNTGATINVIAANVVVAFINPAVLEVGGGAMPLTGGVLRRASERAILRDAAAETLDFKLKTNSDANALIKIFMGRGMSLEEAFEAAKRTLTPGNVRPPPGVPMGPG
jgi:RHS repeat-associated protein